LGQSQQRGFLNEKGESKFLLGNCRCLFVSETLKSKTKPLKARFFHIQLEMDSDDKPNIVDRKFSFCKTLSALDLDELIAQCSRCTRYFAACCMHQCFGGSMSNPDKVVCHHFQFVFTDGACSNNGQTYAKAGLGIVIGDDDDFSWSITVDDTMDSAPRTSQRAELLAAINGLKKLKEVNFICLDTVYDESPKRAAGRRRAAKQKTYIVVSDSEYVVKGITEWFPAWRVRFVIQLDIPKYLTLMKLFVEKRMA